MKADCEMAILLRMYQRGLVGSRYRSTQIVRRRIGPDKMAPHYRERRRFEAIARSLAKKMMLSDAGKSAKVLSLSMVGNVHVKEYLEENPGALEELDAAV